MAEKKGTAEDTKSTKEKVQLEQTKALVELKKTEHKIVIGIINSVEAINNKTEKIKLNQQIAGLQKAKLDFEEKRFASGRSDTDTLIRYQEDLLTAQLVLAQSLFEYKKAIIDLKLAENVLLSEFWKERL